MELAKLRARILIIDDVESVRDHLANVLRARLHIDDFLLAQDGAKGFQLLSSHPVDVVLCDVVMPNMDGFKFLALKKSRLAYKDVPVIMLTGEGDVRAKIQALEAGATDYLTKPFHDEELVARVRVHLALKMARDELRDKNQQLEELSNTDGLTKITNRRHFTELLELEFLRAERYQAPLSYVMIDIDHFKKLNDTYGHLVGDQALKAVASLLAAGLRKHDVIARYGGEEFALLLPHTPLPGAAIVAERYRQEIEAYALSTSSGDLRVTVSMGVSCSPAPEIKTVEDLIMRADKALYQAKDAGRNRVVVTEDYGTMTTERTASK